MEIASHFTRQVPARLPHLDPDATKVDRDVPARLRPPISGSETLSPLLRLLTCLALAATCASTARAADYKLDTSSDRTADFRLAQIGDTFGVQGESPHQEFVFEGDRYLLRGRYGQDRSVVLTVEAGVPPPEAPDGFIEGDVYAELDFRYAGSAANSDVALSLRQHPGNIGEGPGYNTYPAYFVRLLDNSKFELVKQFSHGEAGRTVLDSKTLEGLDGSAEFSLRFSAVNEGANGLGDIVRLTATLLENGDEKAALSHVDEPESDKLYDAKTSIPGGYAGIAAGQGTTNDSAFEGIEITGFQVFTESP
jgi:hypothetical protein